MGEGDWWLVGLPPLIAKRLRNERWGKWSKNFYESNDIKVRSFHSCNTAASGEAENDFQNISTFSEALLHS